jgi:hypothetical protein
MSHSAEEKIKILYEDSLTEIRDLASRMEGVRTCLNDVEAGIKQTILSLPAAAEREMDRASKKAIGIMAAEVSQIAKSIAVDAAASERNRSLGWAGLAVLGCAMIFGATGVLIKTASVKLELEESAKQVELANSNAQIEIDAARKIAGWASTEEGRLANDFFVNGSGSAAAKCDGKTWDKKQFKDGTWCVPQSRPIFGVEGADEYGWKIPTK